MNLRIAALGYVAAAALSLPSVALALDPGQHPTQRGYVPPAREDCVKKPDAAIRDAIQRALLQDPRLAGFDVLIEVVDGEVTLRGVVDNQAAKHAAERAVLNTVGVKLVRNHLRVRSDAAGAHDQSDAEIENDLQLREGRCDKAE